MKKYVREYRGCRVPVKATHFAEVTEYNHPAFYSDNHIRVIFEDGLHFHQNSCIPKNAFPLPEAPQEWMPEIGDECEVLDTCYAHPKHSEVKVKGFYNKQVWLTLPGGEDRVVLIANCKFRPLKTQQEKDREAFIECVKQLLPKSDTDDLILSGKLFDLGFTAPKAGDNE